MEDLSPIEPSGKKPWLVEYHERVLPEDFPPIPRNWRLKIKTAIENRLAMAPSLYGKPLRRSLSGLGKLRVGDYRVIFRLRQKVIQILIVGHRRDVYRRVSSRFTP
ncbi:MAG: type II toxin-antitoxin system RelE/ParE family toxin [Candidatus Vogelbacteria bacterium]|nr:type II toxin-antitoxin system RelE/ParE family toxin [Candidatus Vogelbacteria bacterium]